MKFNPLGDPLWVKQMKALEDIFNPPLLKQINAIVDPPWVKQMKALEDIFNPPLLKQINAIVNPLWVKQLKALEDIVNPGRLHERFGTRWRGPELAFAHAARLTATISPMAAPLRIRDALQNVAASRTGQAAFAIGQGSASNFQLSTEALSTLATLELPEDERGEFPNPDSLLVSAVTSVREAVETGNSSLEQLDERVRVVFEDLKARAGFSSRTSSDKMAVVQFVLALIALILTFEQTRIARLGEERAKRQDSYSRSQRQDGREEVTPEAGPPSIPELTRPNKNASPLTCSAERIVIRAVKLRVSRKARSSTTGLLRPGDLVTLLEESGQLARVERIDHLRETASTGWVPKKYLTKPSN